MFQCFIYISYYADHDAPRMRVFFSSIEEKNLYRWEYISNICESIDIISSFEIKHCLSRYMHCMQIAHGIISFTLPLLLLYMRSVFQETLTLLVAVFFSSFLSSFFVSFTKPFVYTMQFSLMFLFQFFNYCIIFTEHFENFSDQLLNLIAFYMCLFEWKK